MDVLCLCFRCKSLWLERNIIRWFVLTFAMSAEASRVGVMQATDASHVEVHGSAQRKRKQDSAANVGGTGLRQTDLSRGSGSMWGEQDYVKRRFLRRGLDVIGSEPLV